MRVLVAVVSALVLLLTGYGWTVYRQLTSNISTSDVLDHARGGDGATDILLVGMDSRTDAKGNPLPQSVLDELDAGPDTGELNTDTLILVRIPDDPSRASTAVSIPRDSYVSIPGYGTHKINSAYARAYTNEHKTLVAQGVTGADLENRAREEGRRELIQTIEELTGSSIDHYAEVNLVGFAQITQTIGGVPVCLNAAVRDSYSGANFQAGPQTLSGAAALAFVRQRHGLLRGDLDRVVRQQAFLAGLAHKVLSAGTLANPSTLSSLIDVVSQYVVLDQGWDLIAFAGQVQGLTGGNISFRTIPTGRTDLPTPSDGVAVAVDPSLVQAFFADLTHPDNGPAPPPSAASPVIVDVRNATGRTGLAAGVADLIDDNGFAPGEIGNSTRTARSAVHVAAAQKADGERVAQLLGGLPVQVDGEAQAGHVEVVLGSTYAGPTSHSTTPTTAAAPTTADAAPAITADGTPCVN
jgi:LCP family protein required for cell wall assembly